MGTEDITEYAYHEKALWTEQLAGKRNSYQKLLTTLFGSPHEINHRSDWIYKFKWGDVWTACTYAAEQSSVSSGIGIYYDYHQQVNNWDKLASECDRRLKDEQEQNGTHIAHLLAACSLIDVLQSHFDFQKLKPFITYNGFTFPLFERKVWIKLDINPEDMTQKYKIYRRGDTEGVFVAEGDYSRLIDELRLFLENKTRVKG